MCMRRFGEASTFRVLPYLWLPQPLMLFSMFFILSLFFSTVILVIYCIVLAGLKRKQIKVTARRVYKVISVIFIIFFLVGIMFYTFLFWSADQQYRLHPLPVPKPKTLDNLPGVRKI